MDEAKRIRKRNTVIDMTVFAAVLAAVSAVTMILFYRQVYGNPGMYHSDMKAYILEMQGLDSGYSFPYPVFFKFAALIHLFAGAEVSVAVATMLLNSFSIVITKLAFNRLALSPLEDGIRSRLEKRSGRRRDMTWIAGVAVSFAAASLFFISMLYPPDGIYLPGIKFKYLGVFTPNPFHNATYMAARPFTILAFLWYVKLLPVYEKGLNGRKSIRENRKENGDPKSDGKQADFADYVLFSLFLLLATMTKPSFTLIMVSAAGLLMLYRLIRVKFRNFVPTVQLGLCFIPTFLNLLYQYRGVFAPEDGGEGGVGFCFGEIWEQYCDNIPLAVGLAVGFPLLVLILNLKECRKNVMFRFSCLLYLISFAEAFFLYEKGFRKPDFNFSWGYMCGIFFCHFGALVLLLRKTAEGLSETADRGRNGKIKAAFLILQWLAYLWHLICGLFYFKVIFGGAMYY